MGRLGHGPVRSSARRRDPRRRVHDASSHPLIRVGGDATGGHRHRPGSRAAGVPEQGAYPDVGFMPTTLGFSDGGCWRVVARLRGSKVVLSVPVPRGYAGICASLDRQLEHRIDTPANVAFYAAADAECARRSCGA